jgi:hypothetical protein
MSFDPEKVERVTNQLRGTTWVRVEDYDRLLEMYREAVQECKRVYPMQTNTSALRKICTGMMATPRTNAPISGIRCSKPSDLTITEVPE